MKSLSLLAVASCTYSGEAFMPSSLKFHDSSTALYSAHQAATQKYRDSGVRVGISEPQQQVFPATPVSSPYAPPKQWFDAGSPTGRSSVMFDDLPPQAVVDLPRPDLPVENLPLARPEQLSVPPPPPPPPTRSDPPQNYETPRPWYENKNLRKIVPGSIGGPELLFQPTSPALAHPTKRVQGAGSRSTFQTDPMSKSSQVILNSGRPYSPIHAEVKLNSGPADTPRKMRVYSEDGFARPVQASFTNSRAYTQMVDVMNQGPMEFPLEATVTESQADVIELGAQIFQTVPMEMVKIQGQSLKTFSFDAFTEEIRVNLESDGMPVMAKIEVLQGPGEERQVLEVVSDDGSPWEGIITIPGGASSILIRNTGPMEFPIYCNAEAQKFVHMP